MFLHNPHESQVAFFEISATLIPILVFSGVVAERNGPRPEDGKGRRMFFAIAIPTIGAVAVLAELISIGGIVLAPLPSAFVGIVAAVLTGGLVAVILAVWLPWLSAYRKRDNVSATGVLIATSLLLALISFATVDLIVRVVDTANTVESEEASVTFCNGRLGEAEAKVEANRRETEALEMQERRDVQAIADAAERLAIAHVQKSHFELLKIRRLRLHEEQKLYREDRQRDGRLGQEGTHLKEEESETTRCFDG